MFDFRLAPLLVLALGLGCAKANVTPLPTGGHRILCERGMKLCVSRADKVCGDDGYTILSGSTNKHLLGGSSSSYREMAERAELIVRCGPPEEPKAEEVKYVPLPPRTDEPASPPRSAACVPGATQVCVGPGACQGGQVCAVDGSGFGPCDCGPAAAPAPSSSTAPSSTAPSSAPPSSVPPSSTPAKAPANAPKTVPGAMPPAEAL